MPRIFTDQPSSGKPLTLVVPASHDCGFLSAAWTLLAEAPDFSVPGTGDAGATLDPTNPDRELRPGEVFIESPLTVSNTTGTARWAEVMIILQGIGEAYDGAVVLNDADKSIFSVPAKATAGRIYNPVTGVVSTPVGAYPGDVSGFATGVKLNDGRVFTLSLSSTTARIYDTVANSVSTPGGTYPANFSVDSVLLDDGKVFLAPISSTTASIYDPVANTVTTPGGTYPGDRAFRTGILMSNGRVLCVPYASTEVLIFNPAAGGSVTAATGTAGGGYIGAVNLPDGRVFLVPFIRTPEQFTIQSQTPSH